VRQEELLAKFACKEYLDILPLMKKNCGYSEHNIPQVSPRHATAPHVWYSGGTPWVIRRQEDP
jgi:hypothetical protein